MSFDFSQFARENRLMELRVACFRETGVLGQCTFSTDNGQVPQMETVKRYADHWDEMKEKGLGLLLWGMPGSGKTFAAACLANFFIERDKTVRMSTLGNILSRLPAMSPQEKLNCLENLTSCDLLILDDFGMERKTDYAREQIFAIVDRRYLARKPIVITTNLSLTELKNPPDLAAARIFDRLLEVCIPVAFNGGSLRGERGRENIKFFRKLTE